MNTAKLQHTLNAEFAAKELWQSLSAQEKQVYLIATADASGKSWWDSFSNPKRIEYIKNHPASKFAHHLTKLPSHIQHKYHRLSENSKKAVADWHDKTPTEKMTSVGRGLLHAGKHVGHQTKEHIHHEIHTYRGAAAALKHIAAGKKWKDLEHHHRKALRNAILHAGLTAGSMVLGDASGGGIAHLLGNFALEHAHHSLLLGGGEVALKSGKHAAKKATATDDQQKKIAESERIAALLLKAEIPTHEWIKILREIERKKKASKEVGDTKYTKPPLHKHLPHTPDAPGLKPEDWGTKTKRSPIEQKAYEVGLNTSPPGNHGIKSRKDYHLASKSFHEGRIDHLVHKNDRTPAETEHLKYHQSLSMAHSNAAGTYDPASIHHAVYPKHLQKVQDLYGEMEHHARRHAIPTGIGYTRYVTKE